MHWDFVTTKPPRWSLNQMPTPVLFCASKNCCIRACYISENQVVVYATQYPNYYPLAGLHLQEAPWAICYSHKTMIALFITPVTASSIEFHNLSFLPPLPHAPQDHCKYIKIYSINKILLNHYIIKFTIRLKVTTT